MSWSTTIAHVPPFSITLRIVFAATILRDGGDSDQRRIKFAFQRAVSREPDPFQRDVLTTLLEESLEQYAADPKAAERLISTGQAPAAEGLDANRLAAWTVVARAILNMSETITRN